MAEGKAMGGPARCGCPSKRKRPCEQPAGFGTSHPGRGPCKWHGGTLPTVAAKYEREGVVAELRYFGAALDVNPTDLLLECVRAAAGHLAYLGAKVIASQQGEGGQPVVADNVVSIWAQMHAAAIDRAARVSKMALDAGVEEWRVRSAQRAGERLAAAVESAVEFLDLTPAQKAELGRRLAAEFAKLEATGEDDDVVEGTAR